MPWLMSALYDRVMAATERACLSQWRADLLAGLRGEVLEVGAGTGANLPHYPREITRLVVSEPDRYMLPKLEARALSAGYHLHSERSESADKRDRHVEVISAEVDSLPFEDASFDAVVMTLVLCSVSNPERALGELYRILRPGGSLVYLEHVAADDNPPRLLVQRGLEPIWKRVAGNCHLTRRTAETIRHAGFDIEREDRESMRKALYFVRPSVRGIARKPRPAPVS